MKSVFSEKIAARNVRAGEAAGAARPRQARLGVEPGWMGSSFDLAQGCEVKEMESKLSAETLEELFRAP